MNGSGYKIQAFCFRNVNPAYIGGVDRSETARGVSEQGHGNDSALHGTQNATGRVVHLRVP